MVLVISNQISNKVWEQKIFVRHFGIKSRDYCLKTTENVRSQSHESCQQSAFDVLMSESSTLQYQSKIQKDELMGPDKMYNQLIDWATESCPHGSNDCIFVAFYSKDDIYETYNFLIFDCITFYLY